MVQLFEKRKSPLIVKYYEIMKNYRDGIYGNGHLTMHEILEKAGVPNLFAEMTIDDIDCQYNRNDKNDVYSYQKPKRNFIIK